MTAPATIQQAFDRALQRHQAGRPREAEILCREILAREPAHIGAMHLLAVLAHQAGQDDVAVDLLQRVLALDPNFAEAHTNLGNALRDLGQFDQAIASHRRAIALRNNFPEAHNNLGNALKVAGRFEEAVAAYHQAIALRPNYAGAHSNLGNALKEAGQFDEAVAALRRAIALNPNLPEAHVNLGNALIVSRQIDEAIASFRRAVALRPNYAQAAANLGNALITRRQFDEAIAACWQAIAHNPNLSEAHMNLGNALRDTGQLTDAVAAYHRAIALKPDYAEAHSNLLFALHYHPDYDARAIADELGQWNRQHAAPLMKFIQPHGNTRDRDRPLRIGYVSADFREHSVGRFLLPLFRHHDHGAYQIVCFSDVRSQDNMTESLRACADEWRKIAGLSDERVSETIRQDKIDILVDLSAHTAGNRLRVFARKPAPVQATYLAFCSSTGLETIDYRLSDPHLDPQGENSFYTEQTIYLPDTYWCYESPPACPEVSPLPASAQGVITFGCLNNFCKVSPPALNLWMAILQANRASRLILYAPEGSARQRVRDLLQRQGIEDQRLRFVGMVSLSDFFKSYDQIDIALDPFPFNGGTTTCDALWMGVPVVTLSGPTAVGRGGASILTNIGLPDLIAHTPQQYIQIAADLAADLPGLTELRRTLRARMKSSPLMDAPKFARSIEAAYRQMWHNWCQTVSTGS
jgi:protein O-GlcNAc transferase